jgi:hypothetical protein
MSDPPIGILFASFAVLASCMAIRFVILRGQSAETREAVRASALVARRWLLPALPVIAIAYYLCWRAYSVDGLMAVLVVAVAYSGAIAFLRFRLLLRLDLPRGYYLAFGLGIAVMHFGLAAYLWSMRAAFI